MSTTSLPAFDPPSPGILVQRRRVILPYLLSLPALLVCIGILIPFLASVLHSLERYNMAVPTGRGFVWLANYGAMLHSATFLNTVEVSLIYTSATVGIELLLGLGIALLLHERNWLNNIISVALLLPLMTAPAIASLMWKLMTNPNFGVFSWAVQQLGISNFQWASSPHTAMLTVVLVDVWVYTPFMMILLVAGLRSLPPQPFEAARLDGVPAYFVFFRITLPMLFPYIITAVLFRVLDSIQQFDIIYAMTQGGPGNSLMVFQVRAYLDFFQNMDVGRSAAILMVLWAITYFLSYVFVKQWHRLRERSQARA
ncbi:MAG TPA: sugar ABC transporter permease [Acetobacteraceae bacterium]|nr:sugar ABC transporter permease [Acetobacteraceae bacterium]